MKQKAISTSPLILKQNNGQTKRLTRRFTGVFPPNTTFDKNALKAYTKGHREFVCGRDNQGAPRYYKTPQEFNYI